MLYVCYRCDEIQLKKSREKAEKFIISVGHTDRKFYYQCLLFRLCGRKLSVIIRYFSVRENLLVSFSFCPQKPTERGKAASPHFSGHVYFGQTVAHLSIC